MRNVLLAGALLTAGAIILLTTDRAGAADTRSLMDGTFVYSGTTASVPKTIKLVLNAGSRTFEYSEMGGISNHSYTGTFFVLGDTVVFVSSDQLTVKHKIAKTKNGISLTCVETDLPVSFALEPIVKGVALEFYRQ